MMKEKKNPVFFGKYTIGDFAMFIVGYSLWFLIHYNASFRYLEYSTNVNKDFLSIIVLLVCFFAGLFARFIINKIISLVINKINKKKRKKNL